MENFAAVQESGPVTASKPFRDVLACLIAYPLAIFVLIKIVLTANAVAMETYGAIGAAIPAVTMLAVRVANALAYQAFFWIFGLGPVLGGIHAFLGTYPTRRKRFGLAAGGGLFLGTVLLLAAIALPLFRQ